VAKQMCRVWLYLFRALESDLWQSKCVEYGCIFFVPWLVLWLDAQDTAHMAFGKDSGLLSWSSRVPGPTLKALNLSGKSRHPLLTSKDGKPCVFFGKFHAMQMDEGLGRIGTIISVHAFKDWVPEELDRHGHGKNQFYMLSGSDQGPFHGSLGDAVRNTLIAQRDSEHIHASPWNGQWRLDSGSWHQVRQPVARGRAYWTDLHVATLRFPAFNPERTWVNRIGVDRNEIHQFKGYISELLVFDRQLDDAEVLCVESYLKQKWF